MGTEVSVFRVVEKQWAQSGRAFNGYGSYKNGGRWNSPGVFAVYCSGSQSLAAMEVLVHTNQRSVLENLVCFEILLSADQIESFPHSALPSGWDDPDTDTGVVRDFGDAFLANSTALALRVPSVIIHGEYNYVFSVDRLAKSGLIPPDSSAKQFPIDSRLTRRFPE